MRASWIEREVEQKLVSQERTVLEEQWQARVVQVQAAAEKSKQASEGKVAAIIDRLHTLAEKEGKREGQRSESNPEA